MNKLIVMTVLILISLIGNLYAQEEDGRQRATKLELRSKEDKTFDEGFPTINIRDFVYLKNAKMVIELGDVEGFDVLKNLDSLLTDLRNDIAFYKDSLQKNATGNVRIDYMPLQAFVNHKTMRFIHYKPKGEIFINKDGLISKLKLEDDTVRVLMRMNKKNLGKWEKKAKFTPQYTIQVTLTLNNYSEIDKVIGDREMLRHVIDTLQSIQYDDTRKNPYKSPSSAIYRPYAEGKNHFIRSKQGIMTTEGEIFGYNYTSSGAKIVLDANAGIGLIRNTLTPMADFRLMYLDKWRKGNGSKDASHFGIAFSPYFFFDKDATGGYRVHDNWFLSLEAGENSKSGEKTANMYAGLGYLIRQNGDYFKGATMKFYLGFKMHKNIITICPEIIATDNFKQIFPGVTLKIY